MHSRKHVNAVTLLNGSLASKDEINDRRAKLDEPNLRAVLRIGATAQTVARAEHLMSNVKRAFSARATASTHFQKRFVGRDALQSRIDGAVAPAMWPMQLTGTELASLLAWPLDNPNIVGLPPVVARHIPPSENVPRTGRVLGMSNMPGFERPVAVSYADALKHIHVAAPTGAGKSTLLANFIKQDVASGYGVVLIENKGDLFRMALDYIPKERLGDVIVFDVNDTAAPVGFNLLNQGNPAVVIDELASLFDHLYSQGQRGVWTRGVMYHGLRALATDPRYTFLDLGPLMSPQTKDEVAWRDHIVRNLTDEQLKEWFNRLDQQGITKREQIIQPVMDRIWELSRPKLRAILGQSVSSFQMRDVVASNKLLLVNLAGIERDSAMLLGTLLLNAYWHAVKTTQAPKYNYLYLDEFQDMMRLPIDTADMLAKARGFGVGMVLANQHLGQLTHEMQDAIMHNARTKVVFQTGSSDATTFAREFGSLVTPDDLQRLGQYQAVSRVAIEGSVCTPFTMASSPPAQGFGEGDAIRAASQQCYGRPAEQIEREMVERRRAPMGVQTKQRFTRADDW